MTISEEGGGKNFAELAMDVKRLERDLMVSLKERLDPGSMVLIAGSIAEIVELLEKVYVKLSELRRRE